MGFEIQLTSLELCKDSHPNHFNLNPCFAHTDLAMGAKNAEVEYPQKLKRPLLPPSREATAALAAGGL